MRIAKPSPPVMQFARRGAFMAKFRACANVKIYFCKKLLAKFGVKFSLLSNDELLFKFQALRQMLRSLGSLKKRVKRLFVW